MKGKRRIGRTGKPALYARFGMEPDEEGKGVRRLWAEYSTKATEKERSVALHRAGRRRQVHSYFLTLLPNNLT
jgi:hypothetical protein